MNPYTTIYLKKEPTATSYNVLAYYDSECTKFAGRWLSDYTNKPTNRNRYTMLNCQKYKIFWVR